MTKSKDAESLEVSNPEKINDITDGELPDCPSSETAESRAPIDKYAFFTVALMTAMFAVAAVKSVVTGAPATVYVPSPVAQPRERSDEKVTDEVPIKHYLEMLGARPTLRTLGINLRIENDEELAHKQKWGVLLIGCTFMIALTAGIIFIYAYWSNLGNQLLGASLAFCLGGFGAIPVLYAHWMIREEEVVAEREDLSSNPRMRDEVSQDYSAGAADVQRRGMLKWMAAAGMTLFAAMGGSFIRSLGSPPSESLFTTIWKRGQRLMTIDGKPLTAQSLNPGDMAVVFPEDSLGDVKSQTTLIRVDEALLRLPKGRENWAPKGYLAYSRVCTHAGCSVALFEAHTNQLLCPCHQSTFAVLRGAVPTGGPAARPLPQLPLYVDSKGYLRAAGSFTAPPGPGFTGMPA
jgi:ubiquinol-cytochrome c reductase iron-sulfur subunit